MIGIVIVSHSAKLAEGVLELVNQMTKGQVPVAAAGGIDDQDSPIGTDATRIYEAIETVFSDDGVLVLMDMGSALLSTDMALEFFSEEQRTKIELSAGPLVEGAVAAAVQAMATDDIALVAAEARSALLAKAAQLSQQEDEDVAVVLPTTGDAAEANHIVLTIDNFHGLHARPAAQFVSTAGRFQSAITVENITTNVSSANAKSINQVATIGARKGHQIKITAAGPDADRALAALETLVSGNFGESTETPIPVAVDTSLQTDSGPDAAGKLTGIAVAPGVAIGSALLYKTVTITVERHHIDSPSAEWTRLQNAILSAKADVKQLLQQAKQSIGEYEAAIFEAHQLFLDDPVLLDTARETIEKGHINAEAAWQQAIDDTVAKYRELDDSYLQARAADVIDVGQRVLKSLIDSPQVKLNLTEPVILVATDLTPSDTAQLDPDKVLGICTEQGSATSHSAILARALGIPAVVGLGTALNNVTAGSIIALNGEQGQVWIDPTPDIIATLETQRSQWQAQQKAAREAARNPAITRDGIRVEVVANIGGPHDAQVALDSGAEGVGLFRTEFLFLDRINPPTEEEQVKIYQSVGDMLGTRPVVIRTLDIGGDKPLPYMNVSQEENPFLGWRGIRMMLGHEDMFKAQLRAILQASPGHNFKIMFPMVSTIEEVKAARVLFNQAQAELNAANLPYDPNIELGIMVEVPAAAVVADQLALEVDFFSIGTNDLSQYTMAADRTNPKVAGLSDAFQPAVLRLIQQVIQAAHKQGIWVGLCGELAGNKLAAPILLGLGLDEFSMSATAIPTLKQTIAELDMETCHAIAQQALQMTSAEAVRQLVRAQAH
jgi:phosphoenolpyruvate-protein phosphotransferase/dihydroxyacetone kinase phosphotransfer subunit